MLLVCSEDTGMGCRENRKLRPTDSASSAEKQLWGQKDNLDTLRRICGTGTLQTHAQQCTLP